MAVELQVSSERQSLYEWVLAHPKGSPKLRADDCLQLFGTGTVADPDIHSGGRNTYQNRPASTGRRDPALGAPPLADEEIVRLRVMGLRIVVAIPLSGHNWPLLTPRRNSHRVGELSRHLPATPRNVEVVACVTRTAALQGTPRSDRPDRQDAGGHRPAQHGSTTRKQAPYDVSVTPSLPSLRQHRYGLTKGTARMPHSSKLFTRTKVIIL
jgi:hypothetical protein